MGDICKTWWRGGDGEGRRENFSCKVVNGTVHFSLRLVFCFVMCTFIYFPEWTSETSRELLSKQLLLGSVYWFKYEKYILYSLNVKIHRNILFYKNKYDSYLFSIAAVSFIKMFVILPFYFPRCHFLL